MRQVFELLIFKENSNGYICSFCYTYENLLAYMASWDMSDTSSSQTNRVLKNGYLASQTTKNYNIKDRRRQGGTQGTFPPPRNRKHCCRKMVLFPKALFLATTFPKLAKNSIFLLNFYQKFSKFPNNLCFSSKRAKK